MENFEKLAALPREKLLKLTKRYNTRNLPLRKSFLVSLLLYINGDREREEVFDLKLKRQLYTNKTFEVVVDRSLQPESLLISKPNRDCFFYLLSFLDTVSLFRLSCTCKTFSFLKREAMVKLFKRLILNKMSNITTLRSVQYSRRFSLAYEIPHWSDFKALKSCKSGVNFNLAVKNMKTHGHNLNAQVYEEHMNRVQALEMQLIHRHLRKYIDRIVEARMVLRIVNGSPNDGRIYIIDPKRIHIKGPLDKAILCVEGIENVAKRFGYNEYDSLWGYLTNFLSYDQMDDGLKLLDQPEINLDYYRFVSFVTVENKHTIKYLEFCKVIGPDGVISNFPEVGNQTKLSDTSFRKCGSKYIIARQNQQAGFAYGVIVNEHFAKIITQGKSFLDIVNSTCLRGSLVYLDNWYRSGISRSSITTSLPCSDRSSEILQAVIDELEKYNIVLCNENGPIKENPLLSIKLDEHGEFMVDDKFERELRFKQVLSCVYLKRLIVVDVFPDQAWFYAYVNNIRNRGSFRITSSYSPYCSSFYSFCCKDYKPPSPQEPEVKKLKLDTLSFDFT